MEVVCSVLAHQMLQSSEEDADPSKALKLVQAGRGQDNLDQHASIQPRQTLKDLMVTILAFIHTMITHVKYGRFSRKRQINIYIHCLLIFLKHSWNRKCGSGKMMDWTKKWSLESTSSPQKTYLTQVPFKSENIPKHPFLHLYSEDFIIKFFYNQKNIKSWLCPTEQYTPPSSF